MKAYTTEELNEAIDKPRFDDQKIIYLNLEQFKSWLIANGHRKEDKPFGKPYTLKGLNCVYVFIDNTNAYGFDSSGQWVELKPIPLNVGEWQPYPQEKWEAMLLEYAKSRGYKNGNYECLFEPKQQEKVVDEFFIDEEGCVWHGKDEDAAYNQVFESKTGKWAEIIELKEETKEHFIDAAMYAMGVNPSDVKDDLTDIEIELTLKFYFGIDFANVESEPRYTKAEWIPK